MLASSFFMTGLLCWLVIPPDAQSSDQTELTVSRLSPGRGNVSHKTTAILFGHGFKNGETKIVVDGEEGAPLLVVSGCVLLFVIPGSTTEGRLDVSVRNHSESATLENAFSREKPRNPDDHVNLALSQLRDVSTTITTALGCIEFTTLAAMIDTSPPSVTTDIRNEVLLQVSRLRSTIEFNLNTIVSETIGFLVLAREGALPRDLGAINAGIARVRTAGEQERRAVSSGFQAVVDRISDWGASFIPFFGSEVFLGGQQPLSYQSLLGRHLLEVIAASDMPKNIPPQPRPKEKAPIRPMAKDFVGATFWIAYFPSQRARIDRKCKSFDYVNTVKRTMTARFFREGSAVPSLTEVLPLGAAIVVDPETGQRRALIPVEGFRIDGATSPGDPTWHPSRIFKADWNDTADPGKQILRKSQEFQSGPKESGGFFKEDIPGWTSSAARARLGALAQERGIVSAGRFEGNQLLLSLRKPWAKGELIIDWTLEAWLLCVKEDGSIDLVGLYEYGMVVTWSFGGNLLASGPATVTTRPVAFTAPERVTARAKARFKEMLTKNQFPAKWIPSGF